MGMYTELLLKCGIVPNLNTNVKDVLEFLFNRGKEPNTLPKHEFFTLSRWTLIGRCSSCYHIPSPVNYYNENVLFSRSDIKNYEDEIDLFLDWVNPYIDELDEKCIGWIWYEENDSPELIYKQETKSFHARLCLIEERRTK